MNSTIQKAEEIVNKRENLENSILMEEINNRGIIDREEDIKEKNEKKNKNKKKTENKNKFSLSIYIYSNEVVDQRLYNSIKQYNSEIFNWDIHSFIGFSEENSQNLANICEKKYKEKKFKNAIIIPINSISDFMTTIEQNGKDIFSPFNELPEEQQPFFLIIDKENNDFKCYKIVEKLENSFKEDNQNYASFKDSIANRILQYKREEKDFQLKINFIIYEIEKIETFKQLILKKKNSNDDFEIYVNNKLFYQNLYNTENINILNNGKFEEKLKEEVKANNILKISLNLLNINLSKYYEYYEIFEISEVEFFYYIFEKDELNIHLNKDKYEFLDKRNFNIIRANQSPKIILLKYTGYFNQLGDILFCDQFSFYPAKINIAIGGYIGSGKSTLINTIFGEKRCLEGQGSSITNYISQFSLKNYPVNFYDFPGFRAKKDGKDNTRLFVEEIKSKISDLKKVNEIIHCFLFCIKYEERIFDEKDKDMMEVFDAITELKLRTFFIITGSEKEETRGFKNFKKIIINNLTKIKEKYKKEETDKIFGEDLNKNIIPILSRDKKFHEFTAKAFGLDNLFKKLYEYFLPKRITYEKKIFFDKEKLDGFIQDNELLKIFESKNKLSKDFKEKIQDQFNKFLMKTFLKAPKYIYTFSDETVYELLNEMMDRAFYLFDYYLKQQNNMERLNTLNNYHNIKNIFSNKLTGELEGIKEKGDEIKNLIPTAVKILFPILSPLYYLFGTPLFKYISGKLVDELLEKMKIDDLIYEGYFEQLISNLNEGIDDLDKISKHFEEIYILDKFKAEILAILSDESGDIDSKDLNKLKKIFTELLNKAYFNKDKIVRILNSISADEEVEDDAIFKKKKNYIITKIQEWTQ